MEAMEAVDKCVRKGLSRRHDKREEQINEEGHESRDTSHVFEDIVEVKYQANGLQPKRCRSEARSRRDTLSHVEPRCGFSKHCAFGEDLEFLITAPTDLDSENGH